MVFFALSSLMMQFSDSLISQCLLMPLIIPFILLGVMGSSGDTGAVKCLFGLWCILHSIGPSMLLLCKRLGRTG